VGVLVGLNLISTGLAMLKSVSMLRELAGHVDSRNRIERAV